MEILFRFLGSRAAESANLGITFQLQVELGATAMRFFSHRFGHGIWHDRFGG